MKFKEYVDFREVSEFHKAMIERNKQAREKLYQAAKEGKIDLATLKKQEEELNKLLNYDFESEWRKKNNYPKKSPISREEEIKQITNYDFKSKK